MFGKSELMFDFMSDAKSIHNAKNLVGELNQSIWTDYLTGLSVGLSLKKQILIVSIALDEYTIQKDEKIISEIILFVINAAKKHQTHRITNFADFSDSEQSEMFTNFLECDLILSFMANDDVNKEFEKIHYIIQQS